MFQLTTSQTSYMKFFLYISLSLAVFAADVFAEEPNNTSTPPQPTTPTTVHQTITTSPAALTLVDKIKTFPVDRNRKVRRVIVGRDAEIINDQGTTAGATSKLVYSNTLGTFAARVPANILVADDLVLLTPGGCTLDRFTFQVTGRANPKDEGGAYSVFYALYEYCPGAGGPVIVGTSGQVAFSAEQDSDIQQVEIVIPDDLIVTVGTTIWLGLSTSRENVGLIIGAPALTGFSEDIIDFPGFACNATLGGFPTFGHASFNTEVHVRGDCPDAFPAYRNVHDARDGINPGTNVWMADDLELMVDSCELIGYEVGVRGIGFYTFEMRTDGGDLPGTPITGTQQIIVNPDDTFVKERFSIDPPVTIDKNVWIAGRVGNWIGEWVLTQQEASLGQTNNSYVRKNALGQWEIQDPPVGQYGGFYVNIICAGQPPVGACCDMFMLDEFGESVCREVPEMNCPQSKNDPDFLPQWMKGASCDPDPFPFTCGSATCCTPNDTCENLTRNECFDVEPVDHARQWKIGEYCGVGGQDCPFSACLQREGDCVVAHSEPGCERPFCCTNVCDADRFCCMVEWDQKCVSDAALLCNSPPSNDNCFDTREGHGALEVFSSSIMFSDGIHATTNSTDPEFCCEDLLKTDALGSVWYKFVASHNSASISVVENELEIPPLIQVFEAEDSSTDLSACDSLVPVVCYNGIKDNKLRKCPEDDCKNITLNHLTPGNTYYVMVAGRNDHYIYNLEFQSPIRENHLNNNYCSGAKTITDGVFFYDLQSNIADCAAGDCFGQRDIWFDYTATCTGDLIITPCTSTFTPNFLSVYQGCGCVNVNPLISCQPVIGDETCNNVESMVVDVIKDECYKIQIADNNQEFSVNMVQLECIQCDSDPFEWIDPPDGVVDARDFYGQRACCSTSCHPIGISQLTMYAPDIFQERCWDLQESDINSDMFNNRSSTPNRIYDFVKNEDGTMTIQLYRVLREAEVTTITYTDHFDNIHTGTFMSLQGDVNGNKTVCAEDIHELIDILKGDKQPKWGMYSADIDHSGEIHPADILRLIELMIPWQSCPPWIGASLEPNNPPCP